MTRKEDERSEIQEALGVSASVEPLRLSVNKKNSFKDISGYGTSFSLQHSDSYGRAFHTQYVGRVKPSSERGVE
jgi:hypothetical protein